MQETQDVRIALYDVLGRRVRVLYDGRLKATQPLLLPAEEGGRLASGIYFVRVEGETFAQTRRMTVIR